jgi:hypothetical protein
MDAADSIALQYDAVQSKQQKRLLSVFQLWHILFLGASRLMVRIGSNLCILVPILLMLLDPGIDEAKNSDRLMAE